MFTMKKPAIMLVLIILLVLTGYINHNLTQQALQKASTDYQKHEEMEMAKSTDVDEKELVETISEGNDEEEIEILDTMDNKGIDEITEEVQNTIGKTISKEDSIRSKNYFIEQRLARDKLRAGLIDRLNEIVNNDNTNDEMRVEAQKKIMKIGDISEKELTIEGMVKAKGFEEVLAFLTDENVKIIVSKDELSEQDIVKILDIVMGETDLDASNIKIMKKN
ncbi:MAG: SpoIIIAH-like family protein [Tissierellia bacterium]|nr:SpoIIIAH-like family protein [Tissierellia bacterium]